MLFHPLGRRPLHFPAFIYNTFTPISGNLELDDDDPYLTTTDDCDFNCGDWSDNLTIPEEVYSKDGVLKYTIKVIVHITCRTSTHTLLQTHPTTWQPPIKLTSIKRKHKQFTEGSESTLHGSAVVQHPQLQ